MSKTFYSRLAVVSQRGSGVFNVPTNYNRLSLSYEESVQNGAAVPARINYRMAVKVGIRTRRDASDQERRGDNLP